MSEFDTATLSLFPAIGLIALAIGLLARRYSTSALFAGLTGLLSLATASTWIATAGPVIDSTQLGQLMATNAELKNSVSRQQAEYDNNLEAERKMRAKAERFAADAERQAGVATAKFAELDKTVRSVDQEQLEAKRIAADADRRMSEALAKIEELNNEILKADEDKMEAQRRVTALEKELQSSESVTPPQNLPDVAAIRQKLKAGNLHYSVTTEPGALMSGRKGSWYVVRLLQAGQEWNFADRQFALPDPSQVKASAVRFREDVLAPLSRAEKRWTLFVRGAADVRRVTGPVRRNLSYLPLLSNGKYATEETGKQVTIPVQNEHLPLLRADWLREIVQPALGGLGTFDIQILENPPQPGDGRTAELVVFVEW